MKKAKKVWLAVLLNMFPLVMGLGYAYLGMWRRFVLVLGIQFISVPLFGFCAVMAEMSLREFNKYFLVLLWLYTVFDVRAKARAHNAELAERANG